VAIMPRPILLGDIYEECQCTKKCKCGRSLLPDAGHEIDCEDLMSYPRVLGIDPGTHTGWGLLWFDPDVLFDPEKKVSRSLIAWQAGMVLGPEASQIDWLAHRIGTLWGGEGLAVVVEDFIVRSVRMERTFLSPVRIGSRLEDRLYVGVREPDGRRRRREVSIQAPSDALSVCTDQRLKTWQTYLPGAPHPRDAIRHCHLWLRRLKAGGEDMYNSTHFVDQEVFD
jgi:hypothetical protein